LVRFDIPKRLTTAKAQKNTAQTSSGKNTIVFSLTCVLIPFGIAYFCF